MKFSLKRLFLFNNLLTALLPIICIGLLSLAVVKDHLRDEIDINSEQLARTMVSEINIYINEPVGTFKLLSKHLLSLNHSPADITRLLDQVIDSYGYFDAIYLLNSSGIVQQVGLSKSNQATRYDFVGMDFSGIEICTQAQRDKKLHWASSVSMISGEPNMSFCSATGSGTLLAELRIDKLGVLINEVNANKITTSFIAESSGRIIPGTRQYFLSTA